MRLAWEEPFGPVVPVVRVKTVEEAVDHCNANNLALQGCVFSRDIDQGGRHMKAVIILCNIALWSVCSNKSIQTEMSLLQRGTPHGLQHASRTSRIKAHLQN